jgi:hypothetical protein
MTNIFKRRYPGQAIAIIMVVLVVATVLGASLYSRTLKNKEAAINTKDSMMAVEQADSLLDLFVRADFNFLQSLFSKVESSAEGELVYTRIAEISSFLEDSNVDASILNPNFGISNWCEDTVENPNPGSSLKLTIAPADPTTDYVDVRVGSARVFNLEGNTYTPPCSMKLMFEARESTPTLFTIKKIYGNSSDEIEAYVNDGITDDMVAYCFTPDGSPCPDDLGVAQPRSSFENLEDGNTLNIDLTETNGSGIHLYMIRVIPLNNTLAVANSDVSACSSKSFSYLKINAGVNCYGSFREKQIMIPGVDSLGYSSLFDYTIYNTGTLEPSN